jgi:hypothetical protein
MTFILLMGLAILFGYIEVTIYQGGFKSSGERFMGTWTYSYHIPMILAWFISCILSGYWWAIPLFAVLQDASYFFFHKEDELDNSDWSTYGLDGINITNDIFIPFSYLIGLVLTIILCILNMLML